MVAPLIPIIVGAAMAAGGAGAATAGARTGGTRARSDFGRYGGNQDESDRVRDLSYAGISDANAALAGAQQRNVDLTQQGRGLADQGQALLSSALADQNARLGGIDRLGRQLSGFESTAPNVGSLVGQQALDRGRAQALSLAGMARGGNQAGALREALAANTQASADAATQAQITAGQQQLAADQMRLQGLQAAGGLATGAADLVGRNADRGLGLTTYGTTLQQDLYGSQQDAALARESNYLSALSAQDALEGQLQTQLEIERAKGQREKRDRLFQLGGALIGGGGRALSSGGGS